MEAVRLNKYLSDKGVCSRREADRLVEEGQIFVNGQRATMGMKVTDADEITVNGSDVDKKAPEKVIIAVNKPVGIVCTTRQFKGETNIIDMVGYPERLYPVGRLDKDSEGLIFLTNDGAFQEEITKTSGNHEKEYEVTVNKELTDHFIDRMQKGVYLTELERQTRTCKVTKIGEKKFRIVLMQGLNRQIRRMCDTLGYDVVALKRVRIMNVLLGDLEEGKWRKLGGEELDLLLKNTKKKPGQKLLQSSRSGENSTRNHGERTSRSGEFTQNRSEKSSRRIVDTTRTNRKNSFTEKKSWNTNRTSPKSK